MKTTAGAKICIFIILSILFTNSYGQDSIRIKKYDKVIFRDTAVIAVRDVTIPNSSSIIKVKKRWWARFYYDYMFVNPKEEEAINVSAVHHSWNGKIVGDINIVKKEPFGTSVDDSSTIKDWFINAGNTIHILTKDRIILKNLLFVEGDKLGLQTLAESERLLRRLPYVYDARIYGTPGRSGDTVDIVVIVKDVFSIAPGLNPLDYYETEFSLEEANMFGLGQRFYNNFILSARRRLGYEAQYSVYNLYSSYLRGDINLAFTEDSFISRHQQLS